MKLVAIYNTWSDCLDLLEKSVENILPVVDGVIIVYSNFSNYGEGKQFIFNNTDPKISLHLMEPTQKINPHANETNKRNYGLKLAKEKGYDYFLICDSDEFYFQQDVINCKDYLQNNPEVNGLVANINVLFKSPTLWVPDHTLVPFIHKLQQNTQLGNFKHYPFTYDYKGDCHIDPTRRVNYHNGIEMCDVIMWHASWYRKDYHIKINNSAARANILKSSIFKDLENADVGVYNEFYRNTLKQCDNFFNI